MQFERKNLDKISTLSVLSLQRDVESHLPYTNATEVTKSLIALIELDLETVSCNARGNKNFRKVQRQNGTTTIYKEEENDFYRICFLHSENFRFFP